jgi:hypothetical protein
MPAPPRQGNRRPDVRVVAPREVLARLRRGIAKPQVKLLTEFLTPTGRIFASVAPREVLARLRRGVAKPQVKPLIGVSDPYRHGVLSVEPASCVPARGALWQARAG